MASKRKLNSSSHSPAKSVENSMSITTTGSSSDDDERPILFNRPPSDSDSDSDESSFETRIQTPPKKPTSKSEKQKGKIDEDLKKKKKMVDDKGSKSKKNVDDDDGEILKSPKSKKSKVSHDGDDGVIGTIEKGSKGKKSKVSDDETVIKKIDKDLKAKKSKVSNGDEGSKKIDKGSKKGKMSNDDEVSKKIEEGSKSEMSSDEEDSDEEIEKSNEGSKVKKTKSSNGGEEVVKKGAISRVWTEEDEILLLETMSTYKFKGGHDPMHGFDGFYNLVKDMLSFAVTKAQMQRKIKRLKIKFQNAVMKANDGAEPVFSRPFDFKSYELSKKVWGDDPKLKTVKKMDDGNVGSEEEENVPENYRSLYPRLCAELESEASEDLMLPKAIEISVKKIIGALGKAKARELEEKWKSFNRMQLQVYAKRAALLSKQAEALMDVMDLWN